MNFFAPIVLLFSGCIVERSYSDDPYYYDTGDLSIYYTFDRLSCNDAGVDQIEISVSGRAHGDYYRSTLSCRTYQDGVTIEQLRDDKYDVMIRGLDDHGRMIYQLESDKELRVYGGMHQSYDVNVAGERAGLTIYWTFEGSGWCGSVEDVRIYLTDPNGFSYDDAIYDCSFAGVEYEQVLPGDWYVSLEGIDSYGRIVYRSDLRDLSIFNSASNEFTIDLNLI